MRTEEQIFQLMDEDELSLALINAQYDLRKPRSEKWQKPNCSGQWN